MCSAPIFNKSGAPLTPTYTVSLAPELTQHQAGFAHGQQGLRLSWQLGGPAAGPMSRQGKAGRAAAPAGPGRARLSQMP